MKILVSPGYGAGWSTWNSGEVARFMLTYKPIIDFIEAGNEFDRDDTHSPYGDDSWTAHPLLVQLQKECQEKFDENYVCILGADQLKVVDASGQFVIREYDGSEYVSYRDDTEWIEG